MGWQRRVPYPQLGTHKSRREIHGSTMVCHDGVRRACDGTLWQFERPEKKIFSKDLYDKPSRAEAGLRLRGRVLKI
jgi:hypothetical protein